MAAVQPSAAAAAAAAGSAATVHVYSGPGAGTRSVLSTLHSLREALVPDVKVASLGTAELLAGGWQHGCLLLVMPGGADLPYCKALNGRGNQLIREYVENGGAYLGLCAGSYYACARVEFEPGSRLEVVGDRELAFFPGLAAGSVYSGFEYESEAGAVAAPLRFRDLEAEAAAAAEAGSGGGGNGAANGGGGSGIQRWADCVDYVNGGPGFRLLTGEPLASVLQQQQHPGQQQHQQQQQQQQQRRRQQLAGIELLAVYPERGNAAAALLCHVGGGRAVLCGSHPELHPSWLSGQAPAAAAAAAPAAAPPACVDTVGSRVAAVSARAAELSSEEHVQRLQAELLAAQQGRWALWRSLLVAAGLRPWMRSA